MSTASSILSQIYEVVQTSPAFQAASSNLQIVALFLSILVLLVIFYQWKELSV